MKKIIMLFLIGIITLSLNACGAKIVIGEEVPYETNTEENFSMEILELIYNHSAKIKISNNTGKEFLSGNDFTIQVKQDDKWFFIDIESYASTAEAYGYETDVPREFTISWSHKYGALPEGDYRIVISFFTRGNLENSEYVRLSCEFTVE